MSETLPPELANLPLPRLIDEVDYEARLDGFIANMVSVFAARGIPLDTETLETEPAIALLEHATTQDMLLRQAINEGIRSNLLPFAVGGDIDILGSFYDIVRLLGETDEALRRRVVLAGRARSTGGTEPRYKAIALGADVRVADAAIYTVGRDPKIHIAVFATDNAGVADAALLEAVDNAVQAPDVRMVNDVIEVASAAQVAMPITAKVWLTPQAAETVLAQMQAKLESEWSQTITLGRNVTHSWLHAAMFIEGVQRIEIVSPEGGVIIPDNQAAALGVVTISNLGRDY